VFLCTNLGNGPSGTPACQNNPGGTVSGTITPAKVSALPTQNISAGDFDAVEDALTTNTAYVNVHTTKFPAGEIRGEIRPVEDN
jgi:CHRD domain-containing protein